MGITTTRPGNIYDSRVTYQIYPSVDYTVVSTEGYKVLAQWTLTIPQTGTYRICANGNLGLIDVGGSGAEGGVWLYLNGSIITSTGEYVRSTLASGNIIVPFAINYIASFTVGDVLVLRGQMSSAGGDTLTVFSTASSVGAMMSYELMNAVTPVTPGAPELQQYTTGWIANSDWTNQKLGTTAGADLTHNLNCGLPELDVRIYVSSVPSDTNCFEAGQKHETVPTGAESYGITVYATSANVMEIHTGAHGVPYLNLVGVSSAITTQSWWYRIVVTKRQPTLVARNISGDYSTTETDTGKKWINGSTIYRKVISTGAMPNNTTKLVAHGVTFVQLVDFYSIAMGPVQNFKVSGMFSGGTSDLRNYVSSTNISYETTANYTTYTGYCVMEYTKI